MVYDLNKHQLTTHQYWKLTYGNHYLSDAVAIQKTDELIHHSIEEHLTSDVPVGVFLSGGYDSSILLRHMVQDQAPPTAFTLGFANSERSEHADAAHIARSFEAEHRVKVIPRYEDFIALFRQLAQHYCFLRFLVHL